MKNLLILAVFFISIATFSQKQNTVFEKEGNLVKASYFTEDGALEVQGFFKDRKLDGQWTRFDSKGNKTKIAYYKEGKKVGKWLVWSDESLKEINYQNNAIASIQTWKSDSKLAIGNE